MSIKVLYNEIDQYCCAWLSNLMDAGHIRPGVILDKSIASLTQDDVRPYDLVHFFAGIAGWDHALTLAGWQFDGRVTWTGSCPCQPFSAAGAQRGSADERHLWPAFFGLIRECRPATVIGEQVAGAAGLAWLDHVCADLEGEGYAAAAADLPACSAGAPHQRQRLFWVAHAPGARGRWREEVARPPREKLGRPSAHLCADAWPDGYGSGSTIPVGDVCAPSYGIPGRVGRLRAYGNAIVPQVAAMFVRASMEVSA